MIRTRFLSRLFFLSRKANERAAKGKGFLVSEFRLYQMVVLAYSIIDPPCLFAPTCSVEVAREQLANTIEHFEKAGYGRFEREAGAAHFLSAVIDGVWLRAASKLGDELYVAIVVYRYPVTGKGD